MPNEFVLQIPKRRMPGRFSGLALARISRTTWRQRVFAVIPTLCHAGRPVLGWKRRMPLQNRVTPFGELIAVPARGAIMGNRGGVIHDERKQIVRQYASRRWIACVLEFRGRQRVVMSPNRYTELFFMDEAVALAAGHRPCAECRRARFNDFRDAWGGRHVRADEMDSELQPARIDEIKAKVTHQAEIAALPDGTFVEIDQAAWLIWRNALHRYSPAGYVEKLAMPQSLAVRVLTPEPIVRCLQNGYVPEVASV